MTIQKQVAILQCYIHHMKGIEIQVKYPTSVYDRSMLAIAYDTAKHYII